MTSATSPASQPSVEPPAAPAAHPSPLLGPADEPGSAHLPEQLAAVDWLLARLPAAARVLDIGSGTGRPTADLIAGQGHRVTGYDVSETMVELATAQVPAAHFAVADVRELHFAPGSWEAVTAFFSLLELDRAELDATLARIADWLAPGGYVLLGTVLGTVPGDVVEAGTEPADRGDSCPAEVFAQRLRASGLKVLHQQTGAFRPELPGTGHAEQLFLYARKPGGPAVPAHTLAAPYPHPQAYRGPRRPARPDRVARSGRADLTDLAAYGSRVERHDIAPVVEALAGNTAVLHLGAADDALVRALSARGVSVLPGDVGRLPLADAAVDAAVAGRVLHGADDPGAVAAELVRVVDRSHPRARIVLLQGAPDNELVALWNRVCAPLTGEQPDHQGFLLAQAAEVLAEHGFDDLAWHRVPVRLLFPEGGPDLRARAATDVLAGLWDTGDPRLELLPEALLPVLAEHFRTAEESADDTGADSVNDDAVMLVAAPRYHH